MGYPLDADALLIVELDGPEAECDQLIEQVRRSPRPSAAPTACGVSTSEAERLAFWAGRKAAFPAVGRIVAGLLLHGRHHPARAACRRCWPDARSMSAEYGLGVANVFHAGDGNLHPLILYDADQPGQLDRAEAFGADILTLCVAVGGVLTGEHGVGVEKRDLMGEMFDRGRPRPASSG